MEQSQDAENDKTTINSPVPPVNILLSHFLEGEGILSRILKNTTNLDVPNTREITESFEFENHGDINHTSASNFWYVLLVFCF